MGDLVRWRYTNDIASRLGHPSSHVTGIVTQFRKKDLYLSNPVVREEAEVLCRSGNLQWYPKMDLEVVSESR